MGQSSKEKARGKVPIYPAEETFEPCRFLSPGNGPLALLYFDMMEGELSGCLVVFEVWSDSAAVMACEFPFLSKRREVLFFPPSWWSCWCHGMKGKD